MSDKTEQPTPHRLRDAHKKGEVAKSKDLTSTASFAAVLLVLSAGGAFALGALRNVLDYALEFAWRAPEEPVLSWVPAMEMLVRSVLLLSIPVACAAAAGAIAAGVAQVRGVFSFEPMQFKWERLNPGSNLKNLFSPRQIFEVLKTILKVSALGALGIVLWKDALPTAIRASYGSPADVMLLSGDTFLVLFGLSALVYVPAAAIDYFHQHFEFIKGKRMSKDEVKREHKNLEGDPVIKGRRRSLARQAAFSSPEKRVQRANVVVTNPTHFAVALYYEKDQTPLPIVVAKGIDKEAAVIRRLARQHGVPLLENRLLARRLHKEVPLDGFIPSDLIDQVALVFKWVNRIRGAKARTPGTRLVPWEQE